MTQDFQELLKINQRLEEEIAERKRVEAALRESEQRFQAFMDNSPAVAFMKDEQGRYIFLNRLGERRLKVQREDWLGKTDFELWAPDNARRFHEHDLEVLARDEATSILQLGLTHAVVRN